MSVILKASMNNFDWRNYALFGFIIAFVLALVVRLANADALPLSSFEAVRAVPAYEIAAGGAPMVGSQAAYNSLTGLSFFALGASNLTARLAGILLGASLVWVPYVFRRQLGLLAALVIAFGLALDPFLVAYSRLAGGPMIAVSFSLWALVAWIQQSGAAAGVLAGLAMLSGPAFFQGALSLAGAQLVARTLPGNATPILLDSVEERKLDGRITLIILVITLLLAGSLFALLPQGLGAFANSIPEYLQSWWNASGVPALRVFLALVLYQPLALLFGLLRGVRLRSQMDAMDRFLFAWLLVALLLIVIRVGRQPYDLVWAVLPLWGLAGRELQVQLQKRPESWIVAAVQGALIFVLMLVGWLNLAAIVNSGDMRRWLLEPLLLLVGVIATVLIGLGWSREDVNRGLVWGLLFGLGLFVVGEMLAVIQPRTGQVYELWQVESAPGMVQNLETTVGDLSEWATGRRDSLEIQVVGQEASFRWSLRTFMNASFSDSGVASGLPGAVITEQQAEQPQLAGEYRGQRFEWEFSPAFENVLPPDWLRWLVYRQAPLSARQISLWARGDIFPGGVLFSDTTEEPISADEEELFIPELP